MEMKVSMSAIHERALLIYYAHYTAEIAEWNRLTNSGTPNDGVGCVITSHGIRISY